VFFVVCYCYADGALPGQPDETQKTIVSGRVTDTGGNPIANAKINLIDVDPFEQGGQRFYSETLSDKKGRFSLDATPAKCIVSVNADGYASMRRTRLVAEGENRGWDFALPKSVHVSGKVMDAKGNPAPHRVLELSPRKRGTSLPPGWGFNTNGAQGAIETDENGVFEIKNLAPGKYSVIVYGTSSNGGKGFYQEPGKGRLLKVESEEHIENFEITVNPPEDYVISGVVRDAKGNPLRGVYVSTSIPHGSQWWSNTDEDGKFCIEGLDGLGLKSFRVGFRGTTANCEGFELVLSDVLLNSKNVEIIVPEKGGINGVVLNSGNKGKVMTYQITLPFVTMPETGAVWENPPVEIAQNPDGGFSISGVPAGEAAVDVKSEGSVSQRFVSKVEAGKTGSLECVMGNKETSQGDTLPGDRFLRPEYQGNPCETGDLWALPNPDGKLRISPLWQWSRTGIELREGQLLEIMAEGLVHGCQGPEDDWAYGPWGPDGGPVKDDPGSRVCALIGRIVGEAESREFIVGENYRLEVPYRGWLDLGVSDVVHYDNSGEFVAAIHVDGNPVDFTQHWIRELTGMTENLAPSMKPLNGAEISEMDGARQIVCRQGAHRPMMITEQQFSPPIEIRARARTDSTNIRLYYGSFGTGQLIFNWEVNPDELRIHDPATGSISGINGRGWVEEDVFHDIVWRIGPLQMQVLVDGEERYQCEGDYSAVVSPVGIGPALGSRVDVESIVVAPLDPALMDAPAVTPEGTPLTNSPKENVAGSKKASALSAGDPSKRVDPDDLVGWFKLPLRNEWHRVVPGHDTLIPVLKTGGNYYTISWPGAEVLLKPCPEGLEWGFTPSSMEGTKISFDKESDSYSIIIVDRMAMNMSDMGEPEWQPITKVDKPSWALKTKARPPRTNDDFIGWYQFAWMPVRFEIQKEGEKYIISEQISIEPGQWKPEEEPRELKPLPCKMGFVIHERERVNLTYNEDMKRFEMVFQSDKNHPDVVRIRIPLARIPAPLSPDADAVPTPMAGIGIPAWH
jgi:protocatechuate 3,4-dioxygenase beta subunit